MWKKLTAFMIALSLQVAGLSTLAQAQTIGFNHSTDSRLLRGILFELEKADTSHALVEMASGEVLAIAASDITSTRYENGQVWLSFYENGTLLSGRYMEPDLVKHYHANEGIVPEDIDAEAAGLEIGLDRLKGMVEDNTGTVTIAVIDTGIDTSHPWFSGRIVSPYNAVENHDKPRDISGHGTHIAGIIARNTPANVKIMPIRVFNDEGDAPDSTIVRGIDHAVKNGADIINMSLGGYGTTSYLDKAIDYAISEGVMVVASAGNEAKDISHYYPAAFPEVLTVGATGRNGDLLYFSNTGDHVDVCVPGEKIISAAPGNTTGSKSGTSMAAPLVASAAALLLLEDESRSVSDLERIIINHTCDLGIPGKDKLFGYGELTFKSYKADPEFYMISSREEETLEEKFSMNLSYYAGTSVSAIDVKIDGDAFQQIPVQSPGENRASLNIRNLSVGSHLLEVRAVFADGTMSEAYQQTFVVPEYNVRIKVYDTNNQLIMNPNINVMGFSKKDRNIVKLEIRARVMDGVWMANLDFEQLAGRHDKIRCSVESSLNDVQRSLPFYLRVIGTSGEKIFEPSECNVLGLTSKDDIPGCVVTTRILGDSLIGFNEVRDWGGNALEAAISAKDISFIEIEGSDGLPLYAGLLYYDPGDLWIDIYSYSGGRRTAPNIDAKVWYYSGMLDSIDSIMRLDSSKLKTIGIKTEPRSAEKTEYILLNIPTGNYIYNTMDGQSSTVSIMPGFYDIFLLAKRVLQEGSVISDAFYNTFHTEFSGSRKDFLFGKTLQDDFIYDTPSKRILHRWIDIYGNGYSVVVQGGGRTDFCIPTLSLMDIKGIPYLIEGTESTDTGDFNHAYSLRNIPDGIYRLSFINNTGKLAFPVKPSTTLVSIRNGAVYHPTNTPPVAYSDYNSDIRPGDLFVFDLYEEFYDKEQTSLRFSATDGWIVDGLFFYRDLIGHDAEIVITAYDGAGGVTSFTHTIRVTDRTALENDYIPIPDIDSIGATSWAVPYVRQAIKANIVPVDLLDKYQTGITRKEFSSLIVKMAESIIGEIVPLPVVSFTDTTDEDVLKAASMKFLAGSNGRFNPNENISRQQLCVIIYQAIKVIRPDLTKSVSNPPRFRDSDKIASWAREAVDYCSANGIIVGSNGIMNPTGTLSREQAIIMVYKAFDLCTQNNASQPLSLVVGM